MVKFQTHVATLHGLIIRDLMARFGRANLGFVWTVLEPMILTVGIMSIWSVAHGPVLHGLPVIIFVLTGYGPLTLWRHVTNPLVKIFTNNSDLMYHRQVSHFDIMLARLILEFLSSTAALLIIYWLIFALGLVTVTEGTFGIARPSVALAAWLLTGWYYGSVGVLMAAWTEYWEPAEKFIQPIQYLAIPLSGVFFMVDWTPTSVQHLLLLNPAVHCYEMFRAGFFGESIVTHYDPWYLITCSAVLTLISVGALLHIRDRIQVQ